MTNKRTEGSRERRLKRALTVVMNLYNEPGFLLVNYTIARRIRAILGRKLARETMDRNIRFRMKDIYAGRI